jgi:pimeloyl-ACP methyl ester carboxylesterase
MRESLNYLRDFPLRAGMDLTPRSWHRNPVTARLEQIAATTPGHDAIDRLAEIFQPTLVIVGGREMPGFIAWAREIADGIPHATLEILEDMGHLHLLEDPRLVADLISQFTPLAE